MCKISDNRFRELEITRGYIRLLCLPESSQGVRSVSLARIGNYEVRIFEGRQSDDGDQPLFWMELFDHDAQLSIDGGCFRDIKEAALAFEDFISQD